MSWHSEHGRLGHTIDVRGREGVVLSHAFWNREPGNHDELVGVWIGLALISGDELGVGDAMSRSQVSLQWSRKG